jgi:hypothetical protein
MNRKATFAKRQRETDLKDHARSKEARRVARKDSSRTGKGPEIAWDQAVYPTADNPDDAPVTNAGAVVPASGATGAPAAAAAPPAAPPAAPNAASHAKAHEAAAAGSKAAAEKAGQPAEKPNGGQGQKQGSSKLGPRLPSLVPRDDSAG